VSSFDDVLGIAFPFRVDPETGRIATTAGDEKIRQNVRVILATRLDERPLLRQFGTRLRSLVHDPNDDVLADLAEKQAREALLRWEPRIVVTDSQIERDPDDGLLQIRLAYVHMNEQAAGQAVVPLS
jgi:phage baseplate assembly protein W